MLEGSTLLHGATSAIVRVGTGRGFIVGASCEPLIITAAHCLPELPPAMSFSYVQERCYEDLVGDLKAQTSTTVQCLFVDPIADIAVLGEPDGQVFPEAWEAYHEMFDACDGLRVSDAVGATAMLLFLEAEWRPCALLSSQQAFSFELEPSIQFGMSGSPIMNIHGEAVGVVVADNYSPHPKLANHLPAWLVRNLFQSPAGQAPGST